jgi:hypothetical protein
MRPLPRSERAACDRDRFLIHCTAIDQTCQARGSNDAEFSWRMAMPLLLDPDSCIRLHRSVAVLFRCFSDPLRGAT